MSNNVIPDVISNLNTNVLDYLTEVARGNITGHSLDAVICRNPTLGSGDEDIWAGNDIGGITGSTATKVMVQPTGAESYEILSDNAADTLLGTGMRTVLVRTRDVNGVTAFQYVNMNGTTPVALIGTHVYPAGLFGGQVDITATGKNVGTILLRVAGGGDTRNVMRPAVGRSHDTHYKVPAGKTAYILTTQIFPDKNERGFFMNEFRPDDGVSSWQDGSVLPFYEGAVNINFQSRPPLPAGYVLRLQASSGSATQDLSCLFELLLIDDPV